VSEAGAAPSTPGSGRPQRPRRGLFAPAVTLLLTAFTALTVWDWRYGTGFSIREIFSAFGQDNPVIDAIGDTEFGQLVSPRSRRAFVETLRLAVLGTVTGAVVALPLALVSTRIGAPNRVVQIAARSVANVVRALPDILWALLFVAVVGTGALPGLLALFLFTIAVVTKLTADTLDGIEVGPIEAARASGAGHAQMLRVAQVPQILPAYASYVLYAFELNLRSSAVLGIVGAGGIGERLEIFRQFQQWERLWAIVVMFVVVVFVVDRVSTLLRRRLV
jgi:phosphonate transport system permease protein